MTRKNFAGMLGLTIMVAVLAFFVFCRNNYETVTAPKRLSPAPAPGVESGKVVQPAAPPVKPAVATPSPGSLATSAENLTPAEKAMLTRQALAARGQAPRFSPARPAPPPAKLTPLEERVVGLLEGAPSSIKISEVEIFELDPGSSSSYHLRSDVVSIPIPGAASRLESHGHIIYYLPSSNRFYIVWEGMGASTQHFRGPFDGNPYQVLNIPQTAAP